MKAEMVVENPGDVRVTITSTMTVNQWDLIVAGLSKSLKNGGYNHDVAELRDCIREALGRVKANVSSEPRILENDGVRG